MSVGRAPLEMAQARPARTKPRKGAQGQGTAAGSLKVRIGSGAALATYSAWGAVA